MIEFQVSGRKTGKTTHLLNWMKDNPGSVMVCPIIAMAESAYKRSEEMELGLRKEQFVSFSQVSRGALRGQQVKLCVDNLDLILDQVIGHPVDRVSATGIDVLRQVEV